MRKSPPVHVGGFLRLYFDGSCHRTETAHSGLSSSRRSFMIALELPALDARSSLPALIYQLTWQRELFRIFGVNIESVTIVVTAFMLGLGIGSLAGGWISKKHRIPLLPLLAGIELL